jgi:uncharacterized membrane protein YdfJ with MMPL/SSD domain
MTPLERSNTVAARMGRWSAAHRKTAIFGWLAFVVAALVLGAAVGTKSLAWGENGTGESGRADKILHDGFKPPASETVLVESRAHTFDDAAFRARVAEVVQRVSRFDVVTNVQSPLDPRHRKLVSANGHAALVRFDVVGERQTAGERIEPVLAALDAAAASNPGFFIGTYGEASFDAGVGEAFAKDLDRAGLFSLPITIGILVVAFGALVAAGLPVLLALSAVAATMGLLAIPSQWMPVDESVFAIVLLIGLAVGVDYSLFYLKRERQERAAGRSAEAALEAAAATSGRAVLISGVTVMIAMAGMFLTGDASFSSMALATIVVVAVAVVGSLTVLPALLSWLGDRVDRARVPFVHRLASDGGEGGRLWGAVLGVVLRRPLLSLAVAGGSLVALAVPALQLQTDMPGPDAFSRSLPVMQTYDRLQAAFPGNGVPAQVVVRAADVRSPEMTTAIAELRARALASGRMHEPITVERNGSGTVAAIRVPVDGSGTDAESEAALAALRGEIVPATVGAVAGAEAAVTGITAWSKDFNDGMKRTAPYVFAFVLAFAFLLLLAAFRSLVVAAKAVVLNLLSVAAAYGVLVLVFQHGVGAGLIGVERTAGIISWLPVFLFVILFGLSMDYHVFILSRIREAYGRGLPTDEAVAYGIRTTAGVVTSAAAVMVGVFSVFGTLSMVFFKQFGVGLAVAVLLDATIVRAVLLPATMKLLGDWNWYLPRWLEWLPRLEHEGAAGRPPHASDRLVPSEAVA